MDRQISLNEVKGGGIEMEFVFDRYVNLYQELIKQVEDAQIAIAILQEVGKDKRLEAMQQRKSAFARSSGANQPASQKQKEYLRKLGVNFDENLSKIEASRMIDSFKM